MFAFSGTVSQLPFSTIWPQSGSDCDAAIKEASFKPDIIRHAEQRHFIDLDDVLFECKFCREAFPDRRKGTKIRRLKDPLFELEIYPCSSCNRAIVTQKTLSCHNRQCTNMERAIEYIEGHQTILCRVNPDELKSRIAVQLLINFNIN